MFIRYLLIVAYFCCLAFSQCVSSGSPPVCSCSTGACATVGACCINDVNNCNAQYNACVSGNPLIKLNITLVCPCVKAYSDCFAQLVCTTADQPTAGDNCQFLTSQYITSGVCPSSDLSCTFAPAVFPLPTMNCSLSPKCHNGLLPNAYPDTGCSYSNNCHFCSQNGIGYCVDSRIPCARLNPADTVSLIYTFAEGKCDQTTDDMLVFNSLVNVAATFYPKDPVLGAAGVKLTTAGASKTTPSTLRIYSTLTTTTPVNDYTIFCNISLDIAVSLLGLTNTSRFSCSASDFVANGNSYAYIAYIVDPCAPPFVPGPPGGNPPGGNPPSSSGLSTGAIVGIVIGVLVVLGIIGGIIAYFVLQSASSAERV